MILAINEEIWKDIKGYEGVYQVSNKGRVKSLKRVIDYVDDRDRPTEEIILDLNIDNNGYYQVCLSKHSEIKHIRVHKLVYNAFGDETIDGDVIDHIDRDKLNNDISNLRKISYSGNLYNRKLPFKPDILNYKNKSFTVYFSMYGKRKSYGTYKSYEEALERYTELYKMRQKEYDDKYA